MPFYDEIELQVRNKNSHYSNTKILKVGISKFFHLLPNSLTLQAVFCQNLKLWPRNIGSQIFILFICLFSLYPPLPTVAGLQEPIGIIYNKTFKNNLKYFTFNLAYLAGYTFEISKYLVGFSLLTFLGYGSMECRLCASESPGHDFYVRKLGSGLR